MKPTAPKNQGPAKKFFSRILKLKRDAQKAVTH